MNDLEKFIDMQSKVRMYLCVQSNSVSPDYIEVRESGDTLTLIGVEGYEGDKYQDSYMNMCQCVVPLDFFDNFDKYIEDAREEKVRALDERKRLNALAEAKRDELEIERFLKKYPGKLMLAEDSDESII